MIDLHSHILPKMDDGSQSAEETEALIEMLCTQGVTELAATAHFYADKESPEDFLRRREEAFRLIKPDDRIHLHLGAEVAYFPGLQNCEALIPLQIGSTGLLLVEMPFRSWTNRMVEDVCAIRTHLGLTPVLAHINRYRTHSQFPKYRDYLADNDVLFQCNAEAFQRGLSCQWALKQLRQGFVHFLGSDCHNLTTRAPKLSLATDAISKKLGSEALAQFHLQSLQWLK